MKRDLASGNRNVLFSDISHLKTGSQNLSEALALSEVLVTRFVFEVCGSGAVLSQPYSIMSRYRHVLSTITSGRDGKRQIDPKRNGQSLSCQNLE